MRDFIQRMYHAIQEGNVELFDDIEEDITHILFSL